MYQIAENFTSAGNHRTVNNRTHRYPERQDMAVSIRSASTEDANQLYQMICELARYEKAEHCVKVTAADLERQLAQDDAPFGCLIAEKDGRTCGFALYFYAYSTWEGSATIYLEDLYVNPNFRGAGIGAALMSFLAEIAQQKGCRRLEWSVLDWNATAIDFYERLGAKPIAGWTRYRMDALTIQTFVSNTRTQAPCEVA